MRSKMRTKTEWLKWLGIFITALILPGVALAQTGVDPGKGPKPQKIYSPYVQRTVSDANFSEGVFWGDTHLHTSLSTDAGMV